MDSRNEIGIAPLAAIFEQIEAINNYDDLAVYMAAARIRGASMPIDIDQLVDWNDADKYSLMVTQGGLGLPDREYYTLDDEKSEALRTAYVEHVAKMFDLVGLADSGAAAQTIMAFETRPGQTKHEQGRLAQPGRELPDFCQRELGRCYAAVQLGRLVGRVWRA